MTTSILTANGNNLLMGIIDYHSKTLNHNDKSWIIQTNGMQRVVVVSPLKRKIPHNNR